jgi:glycosyltransferase involved in cell wall biosynthesis
MLGRFRRHVVRAAHAVRQAGPGRHSGWIAGVDVADDEVRVYGEVHVPGEEFDLVVVRADGRVIGTAPVDVPTPALEALRPGQPGAVNAGWELFLDRDSLPVGRIDLTAFACSRSGLVEPLDALRVHLAPAPRPSVLTEGAIVGQVDFPETGVAEEDGFVEVAGWVAPAAAVDRVEVIFDDGHVERARLFCRDRGDVAQALDDPTAILAGFEAIRTFDVPDGGRSVGFRVEAVGPLGRFPIGERQVQVEAPAPLAPDDIRWIGSLEARVAMLAEGLVPDPGLNVVVVTHDLGLGGAQLWLDEILARFLAEPDVACTVLSQRDGPLRASLEAAGARVSIIGAPPLDAGGYESAVADLVRLFATEGTSFVIANTMGCFIGVDAAARAGLPSIFAIHEHYALRDFWPISFGRGAPDAHVRSRATAALSDTGAVCFVADATKAGYAPHGDETRMLRLDYGIRLGEIATQRATLDRHALRAAYGVREHDTLLVEVATVEPRKSQSNMVTAVSRLVTDHPHLQLAFVGDTESEYSRLVKVLAHELGVGDHVRFVPVTSEVAPWLVMADGFVLPSDVESLPRSILEAMAFEVPVLATTAGGVSELVDDGITGLTCDMRDVGSLVDGIERLLALDEPTRRRLTDAGRERVQCRHDVGPYTEAFLALARRLVKDPGADPARLVRGA